MPRSRFRSLWTTPTAGNPAPRHGRVFLLRGCGVIFSSGLGTMCRRLRAAGVSAEDLRCVHDDRVVRRLTDDRDAGLLPRPVVLVGHSRGGRRSLVAAQELERLGIGVDLVVCVDVALPPPVPGNVCRAVHLFCGLQRTYPVRPLQAAPGSAAVIENIDLTAPDAPFPGHGLTHLNITRRPVVQDWIVGEILRTTGTEGDASRVPEPAFRKAHTREMASPAAL